VKAYDLAARILIVLISAMLVGCSPSPGKVAKNFLEAVEKGEINKAVGYLSNSTLHSLGEGKWLAGLTEVSKEMKEKGGIKSIKISEENIQGDFAQVKLAFLMGDGSEDTDIFDMIKEGRDWKIEVDPWSK
jgi:hypothetical protein